MELTEEVTVIICSIGIFGDFRKLSFWCFVLRTY